MSYLLTKVDVRRKWSLRLRD